ncbi:MAG: hypothetical protein QOF30_1914 [Acidimicrobiaceae bacterium]|nr:hypothetical protein [Acidimicrobiaceae bacterium]
MSAEWLRLCDDLSSEGGDWDLRQFEGISGRMVTTLLDKCIASKAKIGTIDARGVSFPDGLDLSGLRQCDGLDLRGTRIDGDVTIGNPRLFSLAGDLEIITYQGTGVQVGQSGIHLSGAAVQGRVTLALERVAGPIVLYNLRGQDILIQGQAPLKIDLSHLGDVHDRPSGLPEVAGGILLAGVIIKGSLQIRDLTVNSIVGLDEQLPPNLELRCDLGSLHIQNVEVVGAINLPGLRTASDIQVHWVNCAGVGLDHSEIGTSATLTDLHLDRLPHSSGLRAEHATVAGDFTLTTAFVDAIHLESAQVCGKVQLRDFTLGGSANLNGLHVGGSVVIDHMRPDPTNWTSLLLLLDAKSEGLVEISSSGWDGIRLSGTFGSVLLSSLSVLSWTDIPELLVRDAFVLSGLELGPGSGPHHSHPEARFSIGSKHLVPARGGRNLIVGGVTRIEDCVFRQPFELDHCSFVGGLVMTQNDFFTGMRFSNCDFGPRTRIADCTVHLRDSDGVDGRSIVDCQFGVESSLSDTVIAEPEPPVGLNIIGCSLIGMTLAGSAVDAPLIIDSLHNSDLKGASLRHVNLKSCLLGGVQHLDLAELRGTVLLGSVSLGVKKALSRDGAPLSARFVTSRHILADEASWREEKTKVRRQQPNRDDRKRYNRVEATRIAEIYGSLLVALGPGVSTTLRSDLRYGELEMRRRAEERRADRTILHLFWCFGGYALRPLRPLLWFVAMAIVGSLLMAMARSASVHHRWSLALLVSLRAMVGFPPNIDGYSAVSQAVITCLRLLGPVFLGFAFLAARSRSRST